MKGRIKCIAWNFALVVSYDMKLENEDGRLGGGLATIHKGAGLL